MRVGAQRALDPLTAAAVEALRAADTAYADFALESTQYDWGDEVAAAVVRRNAERRADLNTPA